MVPRVPWNPSFMKVLIILYYDKLTRSVGPVDYNSPTGTLYLMSSKIILTVAHLQVLWSEFWSPRAQLVSCTRPLPSPVLDVLHHQHGEGSGLVHETRAQQTTQNTPFLIASGCDQRKSGRGQKIARALRAFFILRPPFTKS